MSDASSMSENVNAAFLNSGLMIALGVGVICVVGAVVGRAVKATRWKQVVWQVVAVAMLFLICFEVTGVAGAVVGSFRSVDDALAEVDAARSVADVTRGEPTDTTVDPFSTDFRSSEQFQDDDRADWLTLAERLRRRNWKGLEENFPVAEPQPPTKSGVHDPTLEPSATAEIEPPESINPPISLQAKILPIALDPTDAARPAVDFTSLISVVWCTGFAIFVLRWWMDRRQLKRFAVGLSCVDDESINDEVVALSARLSLAKHVRIAEHEVAEGPLAFGIFRPVIVLPQNFKADYSANQRRVMLAHELAHLAARDPAWRVLTQFVCALLWFHPFAWWAKRQLEVSSELAADDAALVVPDGPCLLAECLVRIGRRIHGRRSPGWVAMSGNGFRSGLGKRVDRLLTMPTSDYGTVRPRKSKTIKSLGVTLVLCAAIVSTSSARSIPQTGDTQMSLIGSWKRSLAGLTLLTITGVSIADQEEPDPPAPAEIQETETTEAETAEPTQQERERTVESRERVSDQRERTREDRRDREVRETREQRDNPPQRRRTAPSNLRQNRDRVQQQDYERYSREREPQRRDRREMEERRNRDRDRDDEEEREGTERRLRQMMEAAEKLQKAGFKKDAENLRKIAEELRRHFLEDDGEAEEEEVEYERRRDREGGEAREILGAIREMRREMANLRREVDNLRRRVNSQQQNPLSDERRRDTSSSNRRNSDDRRADLYERPKSDENRETPNSGR